MKRFLSLKMFLLAAFALLAGTMSAEDATDELTWTAKCGGSGTSSTLGVAWTVTSDGTESDFDKTYGIHYGTNKASVTYVNVVSTDFSSKSDGATVTKVVVNWSDASSTSRTVSVKVGDTEFTSTGTTTGSTSQKGIETTFTGSATGEITVAVTRTASKTKAIYIKSIEVTYSTGDASKTNATAQWSDAAGAAVTSLKVKQDELESATFPTFSHTSDGTVVTYSSSNESVATIDANGKVSVVGLGTTTIKGHVDETETYNSVSAEYELTIVGDNSFVEASIIIPGRTYALIASGKYALTTQSGSNSFGAYSTNVSVSGSTALVDDEAAKLTIDVVPGYTDRYVIKLSDGKYAYFTGSKNSLNFTSDSAMANTNYWTITLSEGSDKLTPAMNNTTGYQLQYNSGSPRFACYTGTQVTPTLYILESDNYVDVAIGSLGYASLYYGEANLQVPAGVTALTVDANNITNGANGKEIATTAYEASDDAAVSIAKGTAVILKGEEGTYQFPVLSETTGTVVPAVDCLVGTDTAATIQAGTGNYAYGLNYVTNDQGEKTPGFYWSKGSAGKWCVLGAHKACLILNDKAVSGVRSLTFGTGETTGVSQVTGHRSQVTNIYDLSGRKLSKMQRGVNIVNGRKVLF